MKKIYSYIFTIMLSLIAHAALCMEDETADKTTLAKQLESLREQRKEELSCRAKICEQYTVDQRRHAQKVENIRLLPSVILNDPFLIQSTNRLHEINEQIKTIKANLNLPCEQQPSDETTLTEQLEALTKQREEEQLLNDKRNEQSYDIAKNRLSLQLGNVDPLIQSNNKLHEINEEMEAIKAKLNPPCGQQPSDIEYWTREIEEERLYNNALHGQYTNNPNTGDDDNKLLPLTHAPLIESNSRIAKIMKNLPNNLDLSVL